MQLLNVLFKFVDKRGIFDSMFVNIASRLPLTFSDINECNRTGYSQCHWHATCNNTIGSYTCTCNEGFTSRMNGFICDGKEKIVDNIGLIFLLIFDVGRIYPYGY